MGIVKKYEMGGEKIFQCFCILLLKYCGPLRDTAFSRKTFACSHKIFLFSCKNIFFPLIFMWHTVFVFFCKSFAFPQETLQSLIKYFRSMQSIAKVLWENTEAYIFFPLMSFFTITIRGSVNVHLIFKTTYKLTKLINEIFSRISK